MNDVNLTGIGMTSQRTRERMISRLQKQGISSATVLEAMRLIPRHIFLDEALSHRAYENDALPIGHNQTISQPYIVARMSELLLAGGPLRKVLEVGTGSGYQTAVLAQLVKRVLSVERIKPLQEKAASRFKMLNIHNVRLRHADGGMGWPERGPYDGILSTAAPRMVPAELLQQLDIGGRLVMPVGGNENQELIVVVRREDGFDTQVVESVKFVPLVAGVER